MNLVHLSVSAGLPLTALVDRLRPRGTDVIIGAWLVSGVETAVAICRWTRNTRSRLSRRLWRWSERLIDRF
jgi:hypothetical protein